MSTQGKILSVVVLIFCYGWFRASSWLFSEGEVRGNLPAAVVECEYAIRAKVGPAHFDSPFKYAGTKTVLDGQRFQIAGKVNRKHYGCIVDFKDAKYKVEVIL